MLLDRENQRNRLIQLFGSSNLHTTTEALHDATRRVGRYLRMQFLINAGYGIAVALGLYFLDVPSAIMWGVLGFSLRFLPYLGPWLAAILPILVSLAVSDGWTTPILVACMYIVYELILNNVAEPMLYGSSIVVESDAVIDESLNLYNRSLSVVAGAGRRPTLAPGNWIIVTSAAILGDQSVTLRGLRLQVRALGATAGVQWLLDGRWIARTEGARGFEYDYAGAGPGAHVLTALADSGAWTRVEFRVVDMAARTRLPVQERR